MSLRRRAASSRRARARTDSEAARKSCASESMSGGATAHHFLNHLMEAPARQDRGSRRQRRPRLQPQCPEASRRTRGSRKRGAGRPSCGCSPAQACSTAPGKPPSRNRTRSIRGALCRESRALEHGRRGHRALDECVAQLRGSVAERAREAFAVACAVLVGRRGRRSGVVRSAFGTRGWRACAPWP